MGRPPYRGENQLATLQLVMSGAEIAPLPQAVPSVIRSIVAQALMHDPAQRFQTARALGMAIEDAMRRLGIATTSLHVAQLLQDRIGERIKERRDFIASALTEAASRERARGMLLTAPHGGDADGSGSLGQLQPAAIPADLSSAPRRIQPEGAPHATLVATTVEPFNRPGGGPATTLAIVGALVLSLVLAGVGLFLIVRAKTAPVAAAPASPVTSVTPLVPPPAGATSEPSPRATDSPATPSASGLGAGGATSPGAAEPAVHASASASAAAAARQPAKGVEATATSTPPKTPKTPKTPTSAALPPKAHDDEAGF
jgi:hypothetical protein